MSLEMVVFDVSAVFLVIFIVWRVIAKEENLPSNDDSAVSKWLINWLAAYRGVPVEAINRKTQITNEEIYEGSSAASFHYKGVALCISNFCEIRTVGDLADTIDLQLSRLEKRSSENW